MILTTCGSKILESEPQGDEVIMSLEQSGFQVSKGEDSPMRLVPAPIEEGEVQLTQLCS